MLPDDYVALKNAVTECIRGRKRAQTRLSIADNEINDIYHYIEQHNCDAVTNAKLMKLLKHSLTNRRNAKQYISDTESAQKTLQELSVILDARAMKEQKITHQVMKSELMKEFENGEI